MQEYLRELIDRSRHEPCVLCGEVHPLRVHCYPERKVRDPRNATNQTILLVSILCMSAKRLERQYTKRMLPQFVIPECNIRHDRVLALVASLRGERIDYAMAGQILGTVCEQTIRRHVEAMRRMIAEALVQAASLLATLVSFGVLPDAKVGESSWGELIRLVEQLNEAGRKMAGERGNPVTGGACTHRVYCYRCSRNDLSISLNLIFRNLLIFDTS